MILDNGERTVHENGFQRDMHEGKGRMDLLPWRGIMDLSKHCEEGAKKYGERNIDLGAPQKSLIDSAFRHLAKYHIGMTDESHLRACAWNIMWALEQEVCRPDLIQVYREEMRGPQVKKVGHSVHDERRCVEMTCFFNTEGFCQSVTDLWNPELGKDCPDFMED